MRSLALALLLVACAPEVTDPPFDFGSVREQRFRVRADEVITVDGEEVNVEKLADVRLALEPPDGGRFEIVVYLDRYYEHVVGGPAGDTELSLSDAGLITRGGPAGEAVLGPDQATPGGTTILQLLAKPLGGFFLEGDGTSSGSPWRSYDPILSGIHVVEWVLFSLPVVSATPAWESTRALPTVGRYDLGIELPLRYESRADDSGSGLRVRSSGVAERASLRIAPGLEGSVQVDATSEAHLDGQARLTASAVELHMRFRGVDETRVESVHRFRLSCIDCAEAPPDREPPVSAPTGPETAIQ